MLSYLTIKNETDQFEISIRFDTRYKMNNKANNEETAVLSRFSIVPWINLKSFGTSNFILNVNFQRHPQQRHPHITVHTNSHENFRKTKCGFDFIKIWG